MRVAFYTLGCKVNQNDTESLMKLFEDRGYEIVPFEAGADIYIINTCSVTGTGESKSRQIVRKAVKFNPKVVVVTGCYTQVSPEEVAQLPGVNLLVGMAERPRIVDLVEEYLGQLKKQVAVGQLNHLQEWISLPTGHSAERTRAMLKIEEGCEQFCAYCIVPYARGKVRSMPINQVIDEFKALLSLGYKEIVLTGIHLGSYGKDIDLSLNDVLKKLVMIEGDFRIRLGSIEPTDFDTHLIETIAGNQRICQYLHIPLQSGSDRILESMCRKYHLSDFRRLISELRIRNPLLGVGTDLIVGFPGESDTDFDLTCQFLREISFSRIHVFRFSPRKGTPAAEMPDRISKLIQEERSRIIQEIAGDTGHKFAEKFTGSTVEVLFEETKDLFWTGLSGEYLKVKVKSKDLLKNTLQKVTIQNLNGNILIGEISSLQ